MHCQLLIKRTITPKLGGNWNATWIHKCLVLSSLKDNFELSIIFLIFIQIQKAEAVYCNTLYDKLENFL